MYITKSENPYQPMITIHQVQQDNRTKYGGTPSLYEGGTPIPGPKEGVGGIALKKLVGGSGYLSILGEGGTPLPKERPLPP